MPRKSPFSFDTDEENDTEAVENTVKAIWRPSLVSAVPKAYTPNTELTEKLSEDLIDLVSSGMMISDAAKFMLIHPTTIRTWMRAGEEDPTSVYGWFVARINQAQAVFIQEMVGNVRKNARNDGNVALKALEKAAKGSWEPPSSSEVNIKGTIVHEHVGQELARIVGERKAKQAQLAAEVPQEASQAPLTGIYREEDEV